MENKKINIAELLKDCPSGIELDCTICNNVVTLEGVDTVGYYPIRVMSKDGFHHVLTHEGCVYKREDAKCVIFPKGKTTWEGFVPPCSFKVGDIIQDITGICKVKITEVNVKDEYYLYKSLNINGIGDISFIRQDNWELVPTKFDITKLKPFDKVLVRDKDTDEWIAHFFSYYHKNSDRPYICIGAEGINEYKQCIPYEGNQHLLGTTNNCGEYFKTW